MTRDIFIEQDTDQAQRKDGATILGSSENRNFYLLGVAAVLLGAGLLLLRANLPRWVFGATGGLYELWAVAVFFSYVALGMTALACVVCIEAFSSKRPTLAIWQRLAGGALLIVASIGAVLHIAVPWICTVIVGRAPIKLTGFWILSSVLAVAAYACIVLQRASRRQREEALRLQLESDVLERDLARAELAVLEAQIEPHFLFNTLAHIKRQYRHDPVAADRMLGALINYLERAMPALRSTAWTVGDELGLVQVYLDILALRFGARLQFVIVMQERDRQVHVPALTIATLVENAVRHGLAPKAEGGSVLINVSRNGDQLSIEVHDDGVGLRQASGTGIGLATVRARLRGAFADRATLLVEPGEVAGVRALVTFPAV
jgi:hypothetical protein